MTPSYNVLQPIGSIITGSMTLGDYLEKMFFLLIGISGVLAVVMLVICGIKLMMSEGAGGREAAKKCIWDAVFGLLIAIGAWLLLNTINPQLVSSTLTMEVANMTTQSTAAEGTTAATAVNEPAPTAPGWYIHYQEGLSQKYKKFKPNEGQLCSSILDAMRAQGLTILPGGPNGVVGCFEVFLNAGGATSVNEEAARGSLCGEARVDGCLATAGVQIDKRMCSNPGIFEPGCTTVGGLPQSSLDFIKTLPGSCGGCTVMVTGGVEREAVNHADGLDMFDLRLSQGDALYNAITGSGASQVSFNGNRRWLYNGFWFTDDQTSSIRNWHACKDGTNTAECMACGTGNTLCPPGGGPVVVGSGGGSCVSTPPPPPCVASGNMVCFEPPPAGETGTSPYKKQFGDSWSTKQIYAEKSCTFARIRTARSSGADGISLRVKSSSGATVYSESGAEVNSVTMIFTSDGNLPPGRDWAISGSIALRTGQKYTVEIEQYPIDPGSATPTGFYAVFETFDPPYACTPTVLASCPSGGGGTGGGTPPPATCGTTPSGTVVKSLDWVTDFTGNTLIDNPRTGTIAYKFTVGSARLGRFSTVFTGGEKAIRVVSVTDCPGDLLNALEARCLIDGYEYAGFGYSAHAPGANDPLYCNLEVGKTYYFNVKNTVITNTGTNSCATGTNCPFYRAFQ